MLTGIPPFWTMSNKGFFNNYNQNWIKRCDYIITDASLDSKINFKPRGEIMNQNVVVEVETFFGGWKKFRGGPTDIIFSFSMPNTHT